MKYLILIIGLVFAACGSDNSVSIQDDSVLEIDAHLNKDSNGFYHLKLDRRDNQTLHRMSAFTGHLGQGPEMPKVYWQAYRPDGSVAIWIFQDQFGRQYEVEIANHASYPDMDGYVNLMIGPVIGMVGDTVYVTADYVSAQGNDRYDEVALIFD